MKKSKLKTGDKVKIIRLPVLQSKYGCCIGFNQGVGKVDVVESNDGTHVFLKDCGGCYHNQTSLKGLAPHLKGNRTLTFCKPERI